MLATMDYQLGRRSRFPRLAPDHQLQLALDAGGDNVRGGAAAQAQAQAEAQAHAAQDPTSLMGNVLFDMLSSQLAMVSTTTLASHPGHGMMITGCHGNPSSYITAMPTLHDRFTFSDIMHLPADCQTNCHNNSAPGGGGFLLGCSSFAPGPPPTHGVSATGLQYVVGDGEDHLQGLHAAVQDLVVPVLGQPGTGGAFDHHGFHQPKLEPSPADEALVGRGAGYGGQLQLEGSSVQTADFLCHAGAVTWAGCTLASSPTRHAPPQPSSPFCTLDSAAAVCHIERQDHAMGGDGAAGVGIGAGSLSTAAAGGFCPQHLAPTILCCPSTTVGGGAGGPGVACALGLPPSVGLDQLLPCQDTVTHASFLHLTTTVCRDHEQLPGAPAGCCVNHDDMAAAAHNAAVTRQRCGVHLDLELSNGSPSTDTDGHSDKAGAGAGGDDGFSPPGSVPTSAAASRSNSPGADQTPAASNSGGSTLPKRKRAKACKNTEDVESQRMTHIAVERNRRKQMNEHLSVLRSLMPGSYIHKGDQASIIGGAIEFVKELEHLLQCLQAQKRRRLFTDTLSPTAAPSLLHQAGGGPSMASGPAGHGVQYPRGQPDTKPLFNDKFQLTQPLRETLAESRSAVADVEVKMFGSEALVKVMSARRPGQLVKAVAALEGLHLIISHTNITTIDHTVLYSFTVTMEEDCRMTVEELAEAVQQSFSAIHRGHAATSSAHVS